MGRHLVALAAVWAIWTAAPAAADPGADPGDRADAKAAAPISGRAGRRIYRAGDADPRHALIQCDDHRSGRQAVCKYLDSHNLADTEAALLGDNPSLTPAEASAFVSDAMQVYCPTHIRQVIG